MTVKPGNAGPDPPRSLRATHAWRLLVAGLALALAACLWRVLASPFWQRRLSADWIWEASYVGTGAFPNPATGQIPERVSLSLYSRSMRVIGPGHAPGTFEVDDRYTMVDSATLRTQWEYFYRAEVDALTGCHTNPEFRGDAFVFPRNVGKTTYRLRCSYMKGIPMRFLREEVVEGLLTYLFAYRGRGEYTESYAGTPGFAGVRVHPGQEIRCADDELILRLWVEPVTGEIVKMEESCPTGDFIFDIGSGLPIAFVGRWGGVTGGDDVVARAEQIRTQKLLCLVAVTYGPGCALLVGLVLACAGLSGCLRHPKQSGALGYPPDDLGLT